MEEAGTTGFLPGKKICVSEFFWIMLMQITRLSEIKVEQINFLPKMYNVLPVHFGFSRSSKKRVSAQDAAVLGSIPASSVTEGR
jgi:hypothetical protein